VNDTIVYTTEGEGKYQLKGIKIEIEDTEADLQLGVSGYILDIIKRETQREILRLIIRLIRLMSRTRCTFPPVMGKV
jgi:hypothetical protein